jgi:hypothetical protein
MYTLTYPHMRARIHSHTHMYMIIALCVLACSSSLCVYECLRLYRESVSLISEIILSISSWPEHLETYVENTGRTNVSLSVNSPQSYIRSARFQVANASSLAYQQWHLAIGYDVLDTPWTVTGLRKGSLRCVIASMAWCWVVSYPRRRSSLHTVHGDNSPNPSTPTIHTSLRPRQTHNSSGEIT